MTALSLFRRAILSQLLVLLVAGGLPLFAAQKSIITPLVPVSRWQITGSTSIPIQGLAKFGDNLSVDQEYGVQSAEQRTYGMGSLTATAIFEKATDPSSAYGLYTFYQNEQMRVAPGVQMAMMGAHGAIMTRGLYFIRVTEQPNSRLSNQDLHALLLKIGGAKMSAANLDSLPALLPRRGLAAGSEKYLLGPEAARQALGPAVANAIGFQDGIEVQTGIYRVGANRLRLIEVSYPTPQLAAKKFGVMKRDLQLDRNRGAASIFGRQDGAYALLVADAPSPAAANRLLRQFGVTGTVSWSPRYQNESEFTHQVIWLVLANLELVFIIGGFAIIGGIILFLGKRFVLRYFPRVQWLRPDDEELTRLNLS